MPSALSATTPVVPKLLVIVTVSPPFVSKLPKASLAEMVTKVFVVPSATMLCSVLLIPVCVESAGPETKATLALSVIVLVLIVPVITACSACVEEVIEAV